MSVEILNAYLPNLGYLRRLGENLDDRQMIAQPDTVPNHPAWIIGHRIHSCEAICGEVGIDPWLPEDWRELFVPGGMPVAKPDSYLTKASLFTALDEAYHRLADKLFELGESVLALPLPDSHTAFHIGQLTI